MIGTRPEGNPYLDEVYRVLPRILSMIDTDTHSPTKGQGDRYRWAWKLKDFGSGVQQGAASGLARLVCSGLLPPWLSEAEALRHVRLLYQGARTLTYPDGSLEEAFPYEGSFCVTAQVAFDLLDALDLLEERLDARECLDTVRPLIGFLRRSGEHHGFITNHMASGAAAFMLWDRLSGEGASAEGEALLSTVLRACSSEGWFPEYQGADPGYQTLSMQYLAAIWSERPGAELDGALRRGMAFLSHFVHPDGSFGGCYGSRNTQVYYPAAAEALAPQLPEAEAMARAMARAVENKGTVVLSAMDDAALVPLFNSYCRAAASLAFRGGGRGDTGLPCERADGFCRHFPEAGLLVRGGEGCFVVISLHKGGALVAHGPSGKRIDAGKVYADSTGRLYSAQALDNGASVDLGEGEVVVEAAVRPLLHRLPTPFEFICLRCLNLSVMRIPLLAALIKKLLVRMLITGGKPAPVSNRRTIVLEPEVRVEDILVGAGADGYVDTGARGDFRAMHMAMSGFWQRSEGGGER